MIRSLLQMDPIVVHCSAGIGRTGVLIMMETAMCLIEAAQKVDPVELLYEMRAQRSGLIQMEVRYDSCLIYCYFYQTHELILFFY